MQSGRVDDDVMEEEEDDEEDEESTLRDSESAESTNPVVKSTSEHLGDDAKEKSASNNAVNSGGVFYC